MTSDERQAASQARVEKIETIGGPFVSVVEQTRMPIVFVDPFLHSDPIVFANDAFLRMTGYERDEVLGQSCQILMELSTGSDVQEIIQTALSEGFEGSPDVRYVRKDGSTFWASMFIGPVFGEDGKIAHHYISFIDVSRRRETDLMLDELDHRVKNVLATVQSIVLATLRSPEVQKDRALLNGRLSALAQTHSLLARTKWESVELRDLLGRIMEPFGVGDGGAARISLEGPEIKLRPKQTQTLGLMFQELATNATKYGALTTDEGRITVSWETCTTADRLTLRWKETGGPPVSPPKREGFGSRLIERALSYEVDGKATLYFHRDGVLCEIELPLIPAQPE